MKKILSLLLCLICATAAFSQTYNPAIAGTTSNKPYAPAQGVPTDSRTYYYDAVNFGWRPYQSTAEVLTYLNLTKYRVGQFPIVVNAGGILGAGTLTGGVNTLYYFKNGQADSNLVVMIPPSTGGGGSGTVTIVTATNGAGQTWTITNATTTPNISLTLAYGGDVSGTTNAMVVNKFNGQLPSFYLNYNNLVNTPVIPAQVVLTGAGGIVVSGTYPNLTISGSAANGFTTAGVDLIALSTSTVGLDTLNYRKVDSIFGVNDSVFTFILNNVSHNVQLRGGNKGGGGSTGSVTSVSVVTANGISGTVANPTSAAAITLSLGNIVPTTVNGLTLSALTTGFTIQGGTSSKTLTVPNNASVSGTNTGDVTLAGLTYATIAGQVITFAAIDVSGSQITGVLKAGAFPAQTGDVTNSSGSLNNTISSNVVSNGKLAQMAGNTIKGNNTGSTANALDLTATQVTAMLNTFTTTLKGLVPAPATVTGKVLSDAGTWVVNGTGNPNTKIGSGYWWVNGSDNTVKTARIGYGMIIDSSTTGTLTFTVDTNLIQPKGVDTIQIVNVGPNTAMGLGYGSGNTVFLKKAVAGANITFTQNSDSSWTISATGSGSGGITGVGTLDSQSPSATGAVISGSTIYMQSASGTVPGLVNTVGQTFTGVKTFSTGINLSPFASCKGCVLYIANGGDPVGSVGATNQGIAGQTLHWNASFQQPQWLGIDLNNDVINGILPTANGGNNTSTPHITAGTGITITGLWGNYTISATNGGGSVTNFSFSGGTTGLTGTVATSTTTPALTLSGILGVANGGSGQASAIPFGLLTGGTTSTGALQGITPGAAGTYLRSTGTGSLPVWGPAPGASGTAGRILYYTATGVAYTAPIVNDSTAGTIDFLKGITVPAGNSVGVGLNIGIDANSQIGLLIAGTKSTTWQPWFVNVSSTNGFSGQFTNLSTASTATASIGIQTANYQAATVQTQIASAIWSAGTRDIGVDLFSGSHQDGWAVSTGGSYLIALDASGNWYKPQANKINLDTTNNKILVRNTTTGKITEMSWGVGGSTPTLQQVLTAGSTLSGSNIIFTGSSILNFSGTFPVNFLNGIYTQGWLVGYTSPSTNYTATSSDVVVNGDATSANITVTVPAPASLGAGELFIIKKIDGTANTVTVNVTGGSNIDGASTYVLTTQYQAVTVASTGTKYIVLGTGNQTSFTSPLKIADGSQSAGFVYQSNTFGVGTWTDPNIFGYTSSSSTPLTIPTGASSRHIFFTGTSGVLTLPALSSNSGREYWIKNAGTGSMQIQRAGSDNIYSSTSVTSITVPAGSTAHLFGTLSFWQLEGITN